MIAEATLSGSLQPTDISILSGSVTTNTMDSTAIHYNSTANWNRQMFLISERGHLYIYSDADTSYVNGKKVNYPGFKIGDGSSYLIDLPFAVISTDHTRLEQHISDGVRHITNAERIIWNEK